MSALWFDRVMSMIVGSHLLPVASTMIRDIFDRSERRKPAFESVVMAELPVLYRVAKRLVRSEADAEDLVGQSLLLAAKAWGQFDGRHVRSWLIRILKNEHLGRLRSRASRPETAIEDIVEPSEAGFWPHRGSPDPTKPIPITPNRTKPDCAKPNQS